MAEPTTPFSESNKAKTGDSFDYHDVEHNVVTTPLVSGRAAADKRKQALKALEGPANGALNGRKSDKENRSGESTDDVPPSKRAKVVESWNSNEGGKITDEAPRPAGGGAATSSSSQDQPPSQPRTLHQIPPASSSSSSSSSSKHSPAHSGGAAAAPASVRYPRLNYTKEVPNTDEHYRRADIPGEHKLVYLARRVMEADSRMVESILYNTKYSNLSNEMEKFADMVEERLMKEIDADAAEEEKDKAEYARLNKKKVADERECRELDEKVKFLKEEIKKWEGLEKSVEKEAKAGGAGGRKRKDGEDEGGEGEEGENGAKEGEAYMSPVMKETTSLLKSSEHIRRSALKAANKLMDTLESKLPMLDELEGKVIDQEKALANSFKAAQFAGFPDEVNLPKQATRGLVTSSTNNTSSSNGRRGSSR